MHCSQLCSISVQCPEKGINKDHVTSNLNTLITLAITSLHLQAEKEPLLKLTAVEMTVPRITCQSVNLEPKRFHCNMVPNICFHLIYPSETSFAVSRFIPVSYYVLICIQSILLKLTPFLPPSFLFL